MIIELLEDDELKHGEDKVTHIKFVRSCYLPHIGKTSFDVVWKTDKKTSIAKQITVEKWASGNKALFEAMENEGWIISHKHYEDLF